MAPGPRPGRLHPWIAHLWYSTWISSISSSGLRSLSRLSSSPSLPGGLLGESTTPILGLPASHRFDLRSLSDSLSLYRPLLGGSAGVPLGGVLDLSRDVDLLCTTGFGKGPAPPLPAPNTSNLVAQHRHMIFSCFFFVHCMHGVCPHSLPCSDLIRPCGAGIKHTPMRVLDPFLMGRVANVGHVSISPVCCTLSTPCLLHEQHTGAYLRPIRSS